MARAFPPVAEAHDERVARFSPGPAPSSPGGKFSPIGEKPAVPEHHFRRSSPRRPLECRVECRQDVTTDKGTSDVTAVTMKLAARKVPSAVEQDPQRHPVANSRPELTPQGDHPSPEGRLVMPRSKDC